MKVRVRFFRNGYKPNPFIPLYIPIPDDNDGKPGIDPDKKFSEGDVPDDTTEEQARAMADKACPLGFYVFSVRKVNDKGESISWEEDAE